MRYLLERLANGDGKPSCAIPTDAELVNEFGVACMIVSRALRELTAERMLICIPGAGTVVERRHYESTVPEICDTSDEIAERGHRHRALVLLIASSDDPEAIDVLGLRSGAALHSRIVHYEEREPIQFEDRYVNPALFPAYLEQDFTVETPNQ
ncbi:Mannosyl-D-glycerate transport/metabolism system repressor MngR [Burkholderia puraquae]|uniref:Mannosyl-D-glycerate transport/metabolism system repressor MngR n=1 Tax=Burkholderia puraquae TaxID=1904757 RepID=A0A6J5CY86_9BURK|nr:Mannosyl-D-glycerate transport/metabolism system repressor MngR [Burkholderia puraquae]